MDSHVPLGTSTPSSILGIAGNLAEVDVRVSANLFPLTVDNIHGTLRYLVVENIRIADRALEFRDYSLLTVINLL